MKILLLNPPKYGEFALFVLDDYNTKARSNQVPLGLLYLHSYLKDQYDVKVLDMNALEMPIYSIVNEIDTFQPDIIGITCVIAKWLTVKELARVVKMCSSAPVVVGGVNPSLYPWETLQCKDIDYVVSGFGQIPFEKLCRRIKQKLETNHIHNVYTKNNCDKYTKGSFDFIDVDAFPMPDRSVLPINDYTMPFFPENPCTSMITSMGCPYKCNFCACKNFKPVIFRNTENIIKELKHIESIGIKSVLFQDELFTMSIGRIKELCSAIISNNIHLHWSVRSRANLVHLSSLEFMKEAGCFNIHLGIESGTDRILSEMKKGITKGQALASVNTIKKAGLSCTASFMIGYPQEQYDEIMETIHFAQNLDLNNCQFFITQPEPNTELYEKVKNTHHLPNDIYSDFVLNPDNVDLKQNIASSVFTREELEKLLMIAYEKTNNLYKIKEKNNENNI